jgi:hypothetical protein
VQQCVVTTFPYADTMLEYAVSIFDFDVITSDRVASIGGCVS